MKRKIRRSLHATFGEGGPNEGRRLRRYVRLAVGLLGVAVIGYLFALTRQLPSLRQLEEYSPELATKLYSADGQVFKEFFVKNRVLVPLAQMPDYVWKSVLASEDHRFFRHWGVVPQRWVKATLGGMLRMRTPRGVSTLTQQLARDLYLTKEKSIGRKIKEVFTAIQIERTYSKREILEMYLNQSYLGPGVYGVEAASLYYFGKHIQEVTLPEAALLTALLPNAGYYSPFKYPERAMSRRNLVLRRMRDLKYINEEQYQEAIAAPLGVVSREPNHEELAPYFAEHVRRELIARYGMDIYTGGLRVFTTLDTRVQACANRAIAGHIGTVENRQRAWILAHPETEFAKLVPPSLLKKTNVRTLIRNRAFVDSLLNEKAKVQVALVAIDPSTGHILAMVGGRDFRESEFNRATQAQRQPGSAFKPFVYLAAIDNGYPPCYELLNQPVVLDIPGSQRWTPSNYDGSIGGKTTLREALARSLNLVTARLVLEAVPPEVVVEYARRLGITTPLSPVPAMALGSETVIPIEMVSAFAAFANRGVLMRPVAILRVEDKFGNVLQEYRPAPQEVLSEGSAYIITDMMRGVLDMGRGTGRLARTLYGFTRPAAGKTGTTNDFSDAWFVGFTPQIAAGVWVGVDDPSVTLGGGQSGAVAALPIWAPFMKAAHDTLQLPVEDFVMPPTVVRVEICSETKELATESCPQIVEEVFPVQQSPRTFCKKHGGQPLQPQEGGEKGTTRKVRF
ncbi:MAG: PBP1A family penicillin-binding protein [candidate division KSB1 bacterium]|nr:PBP1A family penicillin-binding protein [candidate division KSB1 bacterium]